MLKKLIVTLIASAFALTAFAQAPKSDATPAAKAPAEKKMDKKAAKSGKKAKSTKGKAKAKSDEAKK
jgi:hypothetical protein